MCLIANSTLINVNYLSVKWVINYNYYKFPLDTTAPSVDITPLRRLDRLMTSATFKCTVHGQEPLEILWSRIDGRPLPKRAVVTSSSKNSKTLVIERLRIMDQETYICSGRNDYGLSTEKATLVVVGMY